MDPKLDLNIEENSNLKTGLTEEFSDLDVNEYSESLFNEDSDQNISDISDVSKNQDLQEIAFFTKKLHVNQIIHTALPVEYPATFKDGVATIYNVSSWDNFIDAFSNIQYSINGHGGASTIQDCPFFGNISVKKDERRCQEIKYCEYSNSNYINTAHNDVNVNSDLYQQMITDQEQNDKWHHFIKVNLNKIDLLLLKKLFIDEQINNKDQINFTRGNIIEKQCTVRFIKIIPFDISTCPFVALICIGTHDHPPPPPEKIPANVKNHYKI
ncbi:36111_t:CDS:2 [Gigaspora margarita]|uniref:36111_t:CDS:1 n=1 Tax=Gigaspora margarita TaxID=4874 RepID=A0ABN7VK81_GIGMA|nr:36111_t:CDS:2 [Gigaspora margarita]